MRFTKEFLQEMQGETISDKPIGNTRWMIVNERIFKYKGKFYKTEYTYGATETQDLSPYQYSKDEIECVEVKPVEKTITVYEEE